MFGVLKKHGHGHKRANRHSHKGRGRHPHGHGHSKPYARSGIHPHKGFNWQRFDIETTQCDNYLYPLPMEFKVHNPPLLMDTATCPLCKNHCTLNEPGCNKGQLYALELSEKQGK
ncbi:MAG: hypothetical protein PVI90_11180 [Desulfobacteraceae bacterium]|jgi:hypothetical protein